VVPRRPYNLNANRVGGNKAVGRHTDGTVCVDGVLGLIGGWMGRRYAFRKWNATCNAIYGFARGIVD
jgi:hypothetical protein